MVSVGAREAQAAAPVAIVSKSRETLEGLELYLRDAGVETTCTRRLERAPELAKGSVVVVIFPDDYGWRAVVAALASCHAANRRFRGVIVTRTPGRFDALPTPPELSALLVVPKPAWGWAILDAIRAQVSAPLVRGRP